MKPERHGRFVTFEGGEGSGKSTQIALLADVLQRRHGLVVHLTREPGGSSGAEEIRALLVRGAADRWDAVTETLLLYAARRDHLCKIIQPALRNGTWVLCDRFNDSSRAYQGGGEGVDPQFLNILYAAVAPGVVPDLSFILDVPAVEGLARAHQRGGDENRYENMSVSFHEALRRTFLDIAAAEPDRCVVIDGQGSREDVHARVLAVFLQRFGDCLPS